MFVVNLPKQTSTVFGHYRHLEIDFADNLSMCLQNPMADVYIYTTIQSS